MRGRTIFGGRSACMRGSVVMLLGGVCVIDYCVVLRRLGGVGDLAGPKMAKHPRCRHCSLNGENERYKQNQPDTGLFHRFGIVPPVFGSDHCIMVPRDREGYKRRSGVARAINGEQETPSSGSAIGVTIISVM